MPLSDTLNELDQIAKKMQKIHRDSHGVELATQKIQDHYKRLNASLDQFKKMSIFLQPRTEKLEAARAVVAKILDLERLKVQAAGEYKASLRETESQLNMVANLQRRERNQNLRMSALQLTRVKNVFSLERAIAKAKNRGANQLAAVLQRTLNLKLDDLSHSEKNLLTIQRELVERQQAAGEARSASAAILANMAKMTAEAGALDVTLQRSVGRLLEFKEGLDQSRVNLKGLAAAVGLTAVLATFVQINKQVKQYSALEMQRLDLLEAGLTVQTETGILAETLIQHQRELVNSSYKYLAANSRALKAVALLSENLEVSADEVARLYSQTRLAGGTLEDIGATLVFIADHTELSANRGLQLANQVAEINTQFRQMAATLPKITGELASIEGRMKSMGAASFDIGKMVSHLSSLEGLGDSLAFGKSGGILDPGSLRDSSQTIANIAQQLKAMTGGSPLLLASMEPILSRMGLTLADAQRLINLYEDPSEFAKLTRSMQEARKIQAQNADIEKRYYNQIADTGQLISTMTTQLQGLAKRALIPLLDVINKVVRIAGAVVAGISNSIAWIQKGENSMSRAIKMLSGGLLFISSIVVGTMLVKALVAVAAATRLYVSQLAKESRLKAAMAAMSIGNPLGKLGAFGRGLRKASGGAGLLGGAGTGFLGRMMLGLRFVGTAVLRLAGPIGLLVTAVLAAVALFNWYKGRKQREDMEKARMKSLGTGFSSSTYSAERKINEAYEAKNYDEVKKQYEAMFKSMIAGGLTAEEMAKLENVRNKIYFKARNATENLEAQSKIGGASTRTTAFANKQNDAAAQRMLADAITKELRNVQDVSKSGTKALIQSGKRIAEDGSLAAQLADEVRRVEDQADLSAYGVSTMY